MSGIYAVNRKNFAQKMENGSMLVVFAGYPPVKRGDESYPYAPQRNFLYMTGIDRPHLAFVIKKDPTGEVSEKLYIERFDEHIAKWDGAAINKDHAKEISGIEDFAHVDELYAQVAGGFVRGMIHTLYVDMENRSFTAPNTPELDFIKLVREKFPAVNIQDAHPMFTALRLIKSPQEVENIRKAIGITGTAFLELLRNVRPGMVEYELEAHIDFTLKKSGCKDRAFTTIMAAGKNATVLHYVENDYIIGENDLVLTDFGARWNWYSADVSRTFPASGKFTERQRQLYNIVLGGLKLVTAMIKPGVIFDTLQESLKEFYVEQLTKIGLIKDKDELSKYYYHGVSHMLGLETHDVGQDKDLVLAPGMVLTVEPGLYIEEEAIGIRIEDDILVTESGHEVLTAAIIKEADEIETFISRI